MDRREALQQQFAGQPLELLEHALKLEVELSATQARLAKVEAQLMEAQAYIEELQSRLSGNKAESLSPEQKHKLDQLRKDLLEQAQRPGPLSPEVLEEEEDKQPSERRSRPRRHPLPVLLEIETVTLEPETTTCHCGRAQIRIGEEVTEELDWVPAKVIRRRIVRPKYACRCGESSVAIAPLPPRLIPQSKLGLGLAVYIVLTRFDDHLSLYRLEQIFAERYDVVIPRQQMVQWIEHIAQWLKPICEAMWQAMKAGDYLQIDETPVKVLDPEVQGRAAKGYLWFYAVPGGDVILEFCDSRGEQAPREKLVGFRGTIQTDAYEVYRALKRKNPALERNGCLAHARRKFYQALEESFTEAVWFIERIRELYRIEDQVRALPPAERQVVREEQAPAIWETLQKRAQEIKPQLLPKSTLGKAVQYFLNEYQALTGYLRDGRFQIDNNLVENAIRPAAVGRRRWLFIGHPQAGWRSAVIYSILISCRRRGLNPEEYLTDVLARLPLMKIHQIHELLPSQWRPPSANTS
jgi:transposase